ncbi:hypothetical protein MTR67_007016 [Solanum verrucosum]|uniref:Uncharacterized protein n=1 Tax=Solanum verrucosum TaxID=315347 RepID=A0AAF0Q4A6_SOLVR|nr:hypothetical protein MTR67_007016 [Solanum verrucosum]
MMDVEVTPSFSTDIRYIEAEFTRQDVDKSIVTPADTSPEVNVDSFLVEAHSPTVTPLFAHGGGKIGLFQFKRRVLSPEGKDQVGGKKEQLVDCREVPLNNTMSPNDPEHNDAKGWGNTTMNYTNGPQLTNCRLTYDPSLWTVVGHQKPDLGPRTIDPPTTDRCLANGPLVKPWS